MAINDLLFCGSSWFRQRIILATLSGRTIKIHNIRSKHSEPGLKRFEILFLKIVEQITNGSVVNINDTGTSVFYQPGLLYGGQFMFDCEKDRSISYFLEALLVIAPFCKIPLNITLTGVTNSIDEAAIDSIASCCIPLLQRFLGTDEGLQLKVIRRGILPGGGGEVLFTCPCRLKLRSVNLLNMGKVKRIRGTCWAVKVSPLITNRMIDSARSILNGLIPDIYIVSDHRKGPQSGNSPGFGMTLVAETTEGCFLAADVCSRPRNHGYETSVPEDLGIKCSRLLLEEIYRGGCVSTVAQGLVFTLMVLTQQDISKIAIAFPTECSVRLLQHIKLFFNVAFKVDDYAEREELNNGSKKLLFTCVGAGFSNVNKVTL